MTIHFLLTPDTSSSLALKRTIAEHAPGTGVVVGTWNELLGLSRNIFLFQNTSDDWEVRLGEAVKASSDSFWSASLQAVPAETQTILSIISKTLTMLLESAGPQGCLTDLTHLIPSGRVSQHLHDLANLHHSMNNILPPDLDLIDKILVTPSGFQLRHIHVYYHPDWPTLNSWQLALIENLNKFSPPDNRFTDFLAQSVYVPPASDASALGVVQRMLFQTAKDLGCIDETIQLLAVRDHLQEAEIAAGMVQQALRDNPELRPADFALLLPNDLRYCTSVRDTFAIAGLPLSGLKGEDNLRDIGNETIHHLLLCMNKPAPVMALTSLLVSPLMPWEPSRGNYLAQQVVEGRFDLREWEECGEGTRTVLKALRNPPETSPALKQTLKKLTASLNQSECLDTHRNRAIAVIKNIVGVLDTAGTEIPWNELHPLCTSESLASLASPASELTREGIAIFYEGKEPWRRVKRMWVLGCYDGHYPSSIARSPVFSDSDLERLRDKGGLAIITASEQGQRLRVLFRRQLCAASDDVIFLIPRRDPLGKPLSPSAAITFMASLFIGDNGKPLDQETMILELETSLGLSSAKGIAITPDATPTLPRAPVAADLHFRMNLLELSKREDGSLKPESPSRLETLMVSPLAWLFERLGVSSRDWSPETLDIMTKGTLAHAVFEHLFAPGLKLPDSEAIQAKVPDLLVEAIRNICPFLQRSEWMVEREQLLQEILRAAQRWAEILMTAKAEILATEISLQGCLDDVPIHGNADLLLALPGKRLYVVDYKKSSSGGRWKRMNKGYDHQAALYRTMIQTGGLKKAEKAPEGLAAKLTEFRDLGEIGAMYYLLNDQNVLTDTKKWLPEGIGGVQEMGDAIAVAAMNLIRSRFKEIKDGRIILNREDDEAEFKNNRGISPYAMDNSPLVRMFMKKGNADNI